MNSISIMKMSGEPDKKSLRNYRNKLITEITSRNKRMAIEPWEELDRYNAILWIGRQNLKQMLSESELAFIFDACKSLCFEASTPHFLRMRVQNAIRFEQLDVKWNVDEVALVEKLRTFDTATLYALADVIEQFWMDAQWTNVTKIFRELDERRAP